MGHFCHSRKFCHEATKESQLGSLWPGLIWPLTEWLGLLSHFPGRRNFPCLKPSPPPQYLTKSFSSFGYWWLSHPILARSTKVIFTKIDILSINFVIYLVKICLSGQTINTRRLGIATFAQRYVPTALKREIPIGQATNGPLASAFVPQPCSGWSSAGLALSRHQGKLHPFPGHHSCCHLCSFTFPDYAKYSQHCFSTPEGLSESVRLSGSCQMSIHNVGEHSLPCKFWKKFQNFSCVDVTPFHHQKLDTKPSDVCWRVTFSRNLPISTVYCHTQLWEHRYITISILWPTFSQVPQSFAVAWANFFNAPSLLETGANRDGCGRVSPKVFGSAHFTSVAHRQTETATEQAAHSGSCEPSCLSSTALAPKRKWKTK